MHDSESTRPSLLIRIRDLDDVEAWTQFADIYGPLVFRFARTRGLQAADAADLTQEVLRRVAESIGRFDYDRNLGRFRGWLFTVAGNKLKNFLASRRRHVRGSGDSAVKQILDNQPAAKQDEQQQWDRDYEQRLFEWAAEQIKGRFRESTWQAFWQTAVEGKTGQQVADALGLSVGSVYVYKGRVMSQLKEQLQRIGDQ